jgi:DNA-binding transcriptional ArsR family regulator
VTVAAERRQVPEDVADAQFALLAKALGHPARIRILRLLLARDSHFCGELVDQLPLAQATVSQHLKVLSDSGLIEGEIDGPRTCYVANRDRLAEFREHVGSLLADAVDLRLDPRRGCR